MMSERFRHSSGIGYTYTSTTRMENDFSLKRTMIIVMIVVGCFAVLWPNVFYPMLMGSANQQIKPSAIDRTTGCCYVLSDMDVDTIKIMSELCGNIIKEQMGETRLTAKQIMNICQDEVLKTCGIDISAVLQEQVRLGQTTKDILDQVRSLNGSLCLKYNFGLAPWRLGVPHIVSLRNTSDNVRQERPAHVRSEMLHPAFLQRGRAIPQRAAPSGKPPRIIEGRPGPIPGMRPPMGAGAHGIGKQEARSMGIIMPIYTVGIVIFFAYTLMRIIFKKHPDTDTIIYSSMERDGLFRKDVYAENGSRENGSRTLVVNAMSALLDEVDQDIAARRQSSEIAIQDPISTTTNLSNGSIKKDEKSSVKIMAMETSESCESGKKWQSINSSVLPNVPSFVSEHVAPPQEIYLDRALSPQSQILVTDSATETENNSGDDPTVVLAGKMTLSVISLENENLEIGETQKAVENEIIDRKILDESKQMIEEEINNMIEEAIGNLDIKKLNVFNTKDTRIEPAAEMLETLSNITTEKNEQCTETVDIVSKLFEENSHISSQNENSLGVEKLKNKIISKENENDLIQTSSAQTKHLPPFGIVDNLGKVDNSVKSDICSSEVLSTEDAHEDEHSEKTESEADYKSEMDQVKVHTELLNLVSSNETDLEILSSKSSCKAPVNVSNETSTDSNEYKQVSKQLSSDISSTGAKEEPTRDYEDLSNDESSKEASHQLKIACAKFSSESDDASKASHTPFLNAKSSSEDSGSTVYTASNPGSVVNVSTRNEDKPEEENSISENEESDDESEEEIEISEEEDIEENEMNGESLEHAGRFNANGDAIFINGEDTNQEEEESDEEEEVEEIIEVYSEEEEVEDEETNDLGHLSSNGDRR